MLVHSLMLCTLRHSSAGLVRYDCRNASVKRHAHDETTARRPRRNRAVVNTQFKLSCQDPTQWCAYGPKFGSCVATILTIMKFGPGRLLPAENSCSSLPLISIPSSTCMVCICRPTMLCQRSTVKHTHARSQEHKDCAKHWHAVHTGTCCLLVPLRPLSAQQAHPLKYRRSRHGPTTTQCAKLHTLRLFLPSSICQVSTRPHTQPFPQTAHPRRQQLLCLRSATHAAAVAAVAMLLSPQAPINTRHSLAAQ